MKKLNKNELYQVKGGIKISGTLVNSVARLVNSLLEAGRSLGSGLRRLISGRLCPI